MADIQRLLSDNDRVRAQLTMQLGEIRTVAHKEQEKHDNLMHKAEEKRMEKAKADTEAKTLYDTRADKIIMIAEATNGINQRQQAIRGIATRYAAKEKETIQSNVIRYNLNDDHNRNYYQQQQRIRK